MKPKRQRLVATQCYDVMQGVRIDKFAECHLTRTVTLPQPTDVEHISAKFEEGVLILTLPQDVQRKTEQDVAPSKIDIK